MSIDVIYFQSARSICYRVNSETKYVRTYVNEAVLRIFVIIHHFPCGDSDNDYQ